MKFLKLSRNENEHKDGENEIVTKYIIIKMNAADSFPIVGIVSYVPSKKVLLYSLKKLFLFFSANKIIKFFLS